MSWFDRYSPGSYFSAGDLEAIRQAAAAAEKTTSGEVVPFVVGRCDDYPGAAWVAATWGAMAAAVVAGALPIWLGAWGAWGGSAVVWWTLPVVGAALVGRLAADMLPALRRRCVAPETMARRVSARAEAAFLEEEVFNTRDRTGVLIFVALFERRVVVLGDAGINARVEQGEWDGIVADLTRGIRTGQLVAALLAAIEACGRLLEERRVERRPDDTNELPDTLRMADE